MRLLFTSIIMLIVCIAQGQDLGECPYYSDYIDSGDIAKKDSLFSDAINYYYIAALHCPSNAPKIRGKIFEVFEEIEKLKEQAEDQKNTLKQQKEEIEDRIDDLKKSDSVKQLLVDTLRKSDSVKQGLLDALTKSTKELMSSDSVNQSLVVKQQSLINAFYFYQDKIGLAYKNGVFYFIDKEGEELDALGTWDQARLFDERTGLAEVRLGDVPYLLDARGDADRVVGNEKLKYLRQGDYSAFRSTRYKLRDHFISYMISKKYNLKDLKILILQHSRHRRKLIFTIVDYSRELRHLDISGRRHSLNRNRTSQLVDTIVGLTELRFLDISNHKLHNLTIPDNSLKALEHLHLSGMGLQSISDNIGQLTNLNVLNVSQNQLDAIPAGIHKLKRLQTLDLSGNRLVTLPAILGKELTSLVNLDLSNNKLTYLPRGLGEMQNLRILNLSGNDSLRYSDLCKVLAEFDSSKSIVITWPDDTAQCGGQDARDNILEKVQHLRHKSTAFQEKSGK